MKKNILFIINNLNCGGAEKALISLLEIIDYSSYNIDLLLFKHEGIFINKIPKTVNLLKEPEGYKYFDMPLKDAVVDNIRKGRLDIAIKRIFVGYIFKTERNRSICDQRVWRYISKSLNRLNKNYDVAIGYLEKNPIYFCVDKVNANKKIGFIHNDYDKLGMNPFIDMKYFNYLDNIITVSEECASVLKKRFPNYVQKVEVMHNLISPKAIYKMAAEETNIIYQGLKIVSVGRLSFQKGFDMAIQACKYLIEAGYNLKWYVIGDGEERDRLEKMIKENNLEDVFVLLGIKENPYPYIREADIYVQPSRFEGKSIAIDEAKILKKPIVVTNFSTVRDQIKNNINGLIVDMSSKSIANGIDKLIKNKMLRECFCENLGKENLENSNEISILYNIIYN